VEPEGDRPDYRIVRQPKGDRLCDSPDAPHPTIENSWEAVNGCVLFEGGRHIRGACESPDTRYGRVGIGADALRKLYGSVEAGDVPFAQDVFGDQFLAGSVIRLKAEAGDRGQLGVTWQQFLDAATRNPVEFLPFRRCSATPTTAALFCRRNS